MVFSIRTVPSAHESVPCLLHSQDRSLCSTHAQLSSAARVSAWSGRAGSTKMLPISYFVFEVRPDDNIAAWYCENLDRARAVAKRIRQQRPDWSIRIEG